MTPYNQYHFYRFRKFLLWLGVPQHRLVEIRPDEFCRTLSEFALEYRTTRERVHNQMEKKTVAKEKEQIKNKIIPNTPKYNKSTENYIDDSSKDAELRYFSNIVVLFLTIIVINNFSRQLLGDIVTDGVDNSEINGTFTFRRRRPEIARPSSISGEKKVADEDVEILESMLKTASKTSTPRTTLRERKRSRNVDRKTCKYFFFKNFNNFQKGSKPFWKSL